MGREISGMLWPNCFGSKVAATCRFGKSALEVAESIGNSDCQGIGLNYCRVEVGVPACMGAGVGGCTVCYQKRVISSYGAPHKFRVYPILSFSPNPLSLVLLFPPDR